mmetsp:Transcript_37611/g.61183  ORF Transcript_37611/g.61183 Transcript_37611/m.61183 type:complete len:312 (-) Transcript_37611:1967-2902(-)
MSDSEDSAMLAWAANEGEKIVSQDASKDANDGCMGENKNVAERGRGARKRAAPKDFQDSCFVFEEGGADPDASDDYDAAQDAIPRTGQKEKKGAKRGSTGATCEKNVAPKKKKQKTSPKKKQQKKSCPKDTDNKKKKKPTQEESEKMILDYMTSICRPFNTTKIFENLNKAVAHPLVKTIISSLVERGEVCEKAEGKTSLFWVVPKGSTGMGIEERKEILDKLKARVDELSENDSVLQARQTSITSQALLLEKEPSDQNLDKELGLGKNECARLESEYACMSQKHKDLVGLDVRPLELIMREQKFFSVREN